MGEVNGEFYGGVNGGGEEDERVHEWEIGLPNTDDLTPLNHGLIPAALLSAFNIKPTPFRTAGDVSRASEDTISMIRGQLPTSNFKPFDENKELIGDDDGGEDGSDSKKLRRNESPEDADSAAAKTLKRPRLVWTPQLHKRFVEVVAHLGIKNAVPKTIMQLMNVEGLTRENVASHLQKYRLYLKRMQGGSFFDGPSNSSSAATSSEQPPPPPPNFADNGNSSGTMPIPMPYGAPGMMPMPMPVPMMGMAHGNGHHMGTGVGNYSGFESNHHNHNHHNRNHTHQNQHQHQHQHHQQQHNQFTNGMMMMQSGNKYGSVMPYHHHHQPSHVAPGDK